MRKQKQDNLLKIHEIIGRRKEGTLVFNAGGKKQYLVVWKGTSLQL
jgi:hypothetical protein